MPEPNVKILVVDDRPDKLLSLATLLEGEGRTLVLANSGREALRHVLRHEFAVILLDINMPGMDGFETAELVRQRKNARTTPIIFVTADSDELHLSRSYSLGAVDYILAPVIPDVLRTKIGVFVELFRKTEQVKRQAESLQRRAAQLQELAQASLAINGALSLSGMLEAITAAARRIIGVRQAVTLTTMVHPGDKPQSVVSCADGDRGGDYEPRSDVELLGGLELPGGTVLRLTAPEINRIGLDAGAARPMRGMLAARLTESSGKSMGVIRVSEKLDGEFTADDEAILMQLAQMASIAIQNCLHAEAREANRLKDDFLATLSHELRTPLNAVLGWAYNLRASPDDAPRVTRGLDVIQRNAEALARMIEDLLDVSRITTGKLVVSMEPMRLSSIVDAALEALRPAAEAKGVSILATHDGGGDTIRADGDRMRQVVVNLLSNAVKFTPRGGQVRVGLRRVQEYVELCVEDDGIGIAPDFLPFVFERFRQAESSTRRHESGLGIGLAIVRQVVELHGGTVHVHSEGTGKGSRFVVTLPAHVDEDKDRPANDASGVREAADLTGVDVLLVEDDSDSREMLVDVLQSSGATVTAVGSAREALELLAHRRPSVLVSDIAMPEKDGLELIREIRQLSPEHGGGVPALALTAYAGDLDAERTLAAGFQMHLSKPVRGPELIDAVAHLAAQRSGSRLSRAVRARATSAQRS